MPIFLTYRYLNILSLDVAAGAVVGCAFFAHILGVSLLPHAFIVLGLTVWIIYTVDHLIDAHKISSQGDDAASTERHRYHQRHFTPLLLLVIGASFIVGMEVFFLRKPVLYAGLGLGLLVIGYMVSHQRLRHTKEFVGALLYTAGVTIAPLSVLPRALGITEWIIITLFASTALANLLLFSWFGLKSDARDDHPSFATRFGDKATRLVIGSLFATILLTSILLLVAISSIMPVLILLLMNCILLIIFLFKDYYAVDDRYRRLGDSIFLVPLIYILLFT